MARYIDAEKADVERISCSYGSECRIEDVQEWLDEQPTADVVEVVRCKSCVHYGACNHFGYYTYSPDVDEDDFCSHGERKVE